MPRGNQMGPTGQGPMTGRGLGGCRRANNVGDVSARGRGLGMGQGGGQRNGWSHQHRFQAVGQTGWPRTQMDTPESNKGTAFKEQELASLQQEAENLQHVLAELKSKIQKIVAPEPSSSAQSEK